MPVSYLQQDIADLFNYLGIKEPTDSVNPAPSEPTPGASKPIPKEMPEWMKKFKYVSNESNGSYRLPVEGALVSRHAPGQATKTHEKGHYGLDIGNVKGTPVYAIGSGVVTRITDESNNPKGGNTVFTSHEDGVVTAYYAHLDSVNVNIGDRVNKNTQIGTVGDSGMIYNGTKRNTKPHLHFQIKINGKDIDPLSITSREVGLMNSASVSDKISSDLRHVLLSKITKP